MQNKQNLRHVSKFLQNIVKILRGGVKYCLDRNFNKMDSGTKETVIDVSKFATGTYFIKLDEKGKTAEILKFIKN